MIAFGAAIPVLAVGALTLGVGFLENYAVESAHKIAGRAITNAPSDTDGTTPIIATWMREFKYSVQARFNYNWNHLMHKMAGDYAEVVF